MNDDWFKQQFERTWPWIEKALQRTGTHSKADLWGMIEDNRAQLHPLPHGAIVTHIVSYPTGITEVQIWLAAGELEELQQFESLICKWAKSTGATRVTIHGRRGWLKKLDGYREIGTIMSKEL